jgi:phosphinothricin acetyltransferase
MIRSNDFTLRKAVINDLEKINEIYNWAVLHSVATFDLVERSKEDAERWFQSHLAPYYPLYVVDCQGEILGWGSLSPFHPRPAYKESGEFSIYVDSKWKGQGVGDMLLRALCQNAEDLGYHTLLGLITASNKASLRLAQKYGFLEVGRYREVGFKFGERLDVVVVQRLFSN